MFQIDINNKNFPKRLKEIPKMPKALYTEGNIELLETNSVAVIGSRKHSEYGEKMCKAFVKELVKYGITIISGMAKGIDTIAHVTCLENGGKTIAVLPCGLNNIYPKENRGLYKDIINLGGLAVTEYEENTEADSKKFLQRNRIVCGLALGTLVVEAGHRSGTSVTARYTFEQGKNVFCIPSSLDNKKGITSNKIIQKGGKLVTCVEDILEEYPDINFEKREIGEEEADNYKESKIEKEFIKIYKILGDKPININEISKITGYSIEEVNYQLMMLEIRGEVIQLPGKEFIRK